MNVMHTIRPMESKSISSSLLTSIWLQELHVLAPWRPLASYIQVAQYLVAS